MPRNIGDAELPSGNDTDAPLPYAGTGINRDGEVFLYGLFSRHPMSREEMRRQKLNEGYFFGFMGDDGFSSTFAENLAEARKRAGYTQNEVSRITNITVSSIRRYESGDSPVPIGRAAKLAILYGTSLDRLLGTIGAEEEHLLDCYRFSSDQSRERIIADAERHQSDRAAAENEWLDLVRDVRQKVADGVYKKVALDFFLDTEANARKLGIWPFE